MRNGIGKNAKAHLPLPATYGYIRSLYVLPMRRLKKEIAMGVTACRNRRAEFPSNDRPSDPRRRSEPFRSAEEAWFWTMAALMARRDGARYTANQGRVSRPCEPDDVVKCLDGLYRRRRIDLVHARIMRIWGERQAAPNPA